MLILSILVLDFEMMEHADDICVCGRHYSIGLY